MRIDAAHGIRMMMMMMLVLADILNMVSDESLRGRMKTIEATTGFRMLFALFNAPMSSLSDY